MTDYPKRGEHDDSLGEISGFGGGYEEACRKMLKAGVEWLDQFPNMEPQYKGFEGVFGLAMEDNTAAKGLSEAVAAAEPGCSGAMHHAVINRLLFIRKNGWEAYCKQLRENVAKRQLVGS